MKNKKPVNLYQSVFDDEKCKVKENGLSDLTKMTKLCRKSWHVRVIRYAEIIPMMFYDLDPKSMIFKTALKSWIKSNIPKEGDHIFKGKIKKFSEGEETDWLCLELSEWKEREAHFLRGFEEFHICDEYL